MRVDSNTQRTFGCDMISKKCSEAYEVYFRGKMLCQCSRSDMLGAFRDNELHTPAQRITGKERRMTRSTLSYAVSTDNGVISEEEVSANVAESKRIEGEFRTFRSHMDLTDRLASLGAHSAALAHELKQPLTVVSLSLDDALDKLTEASSNLESSTEGLKDALKQVPNIMSIVDRFRSLVRDSSDEPVTHVDVGVVADRVAKLFRGSSMRMKIVLDVEKMDSLPPVAMNERDLEQLFFALFENAIHAADGEEGRQLIVNGVTKDHCIELRFSDNCGGIPSEAVDKVFEPFFSTKPPDQGTGLGLYVVQQIVSRVGGRVRVKSKSGNGSTFFVTLPVNGDRPRLTGAQPTKRGPYPQ